MPLDMCLMRIMSAVWAALNAMSANFRMVIFQTLSRCMAVPSAVLPMRASMSVCHSMSQRFIAPFSIEPVSVSPMRKVSGVLKRGSSVILTSLFLMSSSAEHVPR